MIMSTSVSPAAFTISDTKPDSSAAFPFCILLIDSLTMSLYIKWGKPLMVSAGINNSYPMQSVFKYSSLTPLLTSLFHHNVTLCMAGSFVNPQFLSVASRKAAFQNIPITFNRSIFLILSLHLLMSWNHSFSWVQTSLLVSFSYCRTMYQRLMLSEILFTT